MSDTLREKLRREVRRHRFMVTGCSDQSMCCSCQEGCCDEQGWMLTMTPDEHLDHIADAILAIPGIAVVELPEPAEAGRCWPVLVGGEPESLYLSQGEIVISGNLRLYTDEATSLAAALLAAADYAERER